MFLREKLKGFSDSLLYQFLLVSLQLCDKKVRFGHLVVAIEHYTEGINMQIWQVEILSWLQTRAGSEAWGNCAHVITFEAIFKLLYWRNKPLFTASRFALNLKTPFACQLQSSIPFSFKHRCLIYFPIKTSFSSAEFSLLLYNCFIKTFLSHFLLVHIMENFSSGCHLWFHPVTSSS